MQTHSNSPLGSSGPGADPKAPCGATTAVPQFCSEAFVGSLVDTRKANCSLELCGPRLLASSRHDLGRFLAVFWQILSRFLTGSWHGVSWQNCSAICKFRCRIYPKIHQQLCHKRPKINQNGAQVRSRRPLGSQSVPGTVFWSNTGSFGSNFFKILTIFGAIFGPAGCQRGSQNQLFWHKIISGVLPFAPWRGFQKKHEILIDI